MDDFQPGGIDDYDWSTLLPEPASAPSPAPEEPAPPPIAPAPRRRSPDYQEDRPGVDLLPQAYRTGAKNIYKRQAPTDFEGGGIDDYDWGAGAPAVSGEPAYDPNDDYALTRGMKVAADQGTRSLSAIGDLARLQGLRPEEQVAEMLRLGQQANDPAAPRLEVEGVTDIHGFGDLLTWLGESAGQMAGSMYAAALWGGGTGAAAGAGIGATSGALGGPLGAGAGALAGAATGAFYGTGSAFLGMGVGSTFMDLLHDKGVQEGLENGTVTPQEIYAWSVGAGGTIGALDALPAANVLAKASGQQIKKDAVKQLVRKAALQGALKTGLEEGATEALQGAISELGQALVGGNMDLANRAISVLDQGLAGAVGGVLPGAAGGVMENAQIPAPADQANAAGPAGTAAPPVQPNSGPPDPTGTTGPGTGGATRPVPPAGADQNRSDKREQGKEPTFTTPGTVVPDGEVAPDIAASFGYEDEEVEPTATPPEPAAVDPAVAVALGAAPEEQLAPGTPVSPWPKRRRPAPAAPPEVPTPVEQPVAPQVPDEVAAAPLPPVTAEEAAANAVSPFPTRRRAQSAVAEAPVPTPAPMPTPAVEPAPPLTPSVTEPPPETLVSPEEEPLLPETPPPPAPAVTAEPLLLAESPELQALSRYAEGLQPYAPQPGRPEPQVQETPRVTKQPDWVKVLPTAAARKEAMQKLRAAQKKRVPREIRRRKKYWDWEGPGGKIPARVPVFEKKAGRKLEEPPEIRQVQPTAKADAQAKLDSLTDRSRYEYFWNKLHPDLREALPQRYRPARRFAKQVAARQRGAAERVEPSGPPIALPGPVHAPRPPIEVKKPVRAPIESVEALREKRRLPVNETFYQRLKATVSETNQPDVYGASSGRRMGRIRAITDEGVKVSWRNKLIPKAEFVGRFTVPYVHEAMATEAPAATPARAAPPAVVEEKPYKQPEAEKRIERLKKKAETWRDIGRRAKERAEAAARAAVQQRESREILAKVEAGEVTVHEVTPPSLDWMPKEPDPALIADTAQSQYAMRISAINNIKAHGRRTKAGYKSAEDMEGESFKTTKRDAWDAYRDKKTGKKKKRPNPDLDPVGAITWDMGEQRQLIADEGSVKTDAGVFYLAEFNALNKKRIAAQRKIDKRTEKRLAKAEQALEDERQLYQSYVDELAEQNHIDDEQAKDLRSAYNDSFKYKTLKAREQVSTPIIGRLLTTHTLPMPPTAEPQARLKYTPTGRMKRPKTKESWEDILARSRKRLRETTALQAQRKKGTGRGNALIREEEATTKTITRNYMADLHRHLGNLVRNVEMEMKKAGVELPKSLDRNDNSPEENMIIYIRGRVGMIDDPEAQARDNNFQRGQTLVDAAGMIQEWLGGMYTHQLNEETGKKERLSKPRRWLAYRQSIDKLYGQIMEQQHAPNSVSIERRREMMQTSGLAEATEGEFGITGLTGEALSETEEGGESIYAIIEQASEDTAMGAAGKAALKRYADRLLANADRKVREGAERVKGEARAAPRVQKGFISESPTQVEGEGGTTRSMSGSEALAKYVRVPKGTLRADVVAEMKRLVGDVPVHFIPGSQVRDMRGGRSPAGFYDFETHSIYINDAIRDPDVLAEVVVHEMVHASTVYALEHNLRGTADIMNRIRQGMREQVEFGDAVLDDNLKNNAEMIAAALQSGDFQALAKSLKIPVRHRAALRALSRGRPAASMWDWITAAFENAVGVFSPAGRRSYMDELLSLYPDIGMSTAEQEAEAASRPGGRVGEAIGANAIMDAPFDAASFGPVVRQALDSAAMGTVKDVALKSRRTFRRAFVSTERLRKMVADEFFGGKLNNPHARILDTMVTHARRIEDEAKEGDRRSTAIVEWVHAGDPDQRWQELGRMLTVLSESAYDNLDARVDENNQPNLRDDAKHPTQKPRKTPTLKHRMDEGRKKLAKKYHDAWMEGDPELRELLSHRVEHMSEQMAKYKRKTIAHHLKLLTTKTNNRVKLPKSISFDDAVNQIYTGQVSEALETALGANAESILGPIQWFNENKLYFPTHRAGEYMISGQKEIATPEGATLDKSAYDSKGTLRFVFKTLEEARAYEEAQADGGERIIAKSRIWVHPKYPDRKVRASDHGVMRNAQGKYETWEPVARYTVTVQGRHMEMGDSPYELARRKKELEAEGYSVSDPISMRDNKWPEKNLMPGQLGALNHAIDSMAGISDQDKALARSMVTVAYVQSQQGSRLGKRLLRRQMVGGYNTGTTELMQALSTNNDMMARQIVAVDRSSELNAAIADADAFLEAARQQTRKRPDPKAMKELPRQWRGVIERNYGKDDPLRVTRLSNDIREAKDRVLASMAPTAEVVDKFLSEQTQQSILSTIVMTYLFKPAYFVVQMLGLVMQSTGKMMGEMSKTAGVGAPFAMARYLRGASADAGFWSNYGKALVDMTVEAGHLAKGFVPRKDFMRRGRPMPKPRSYVEETIERMRANGARNLAAKEKLLERARQRNLIGQAGLEQQNIRYDLMGEGVPAKINRFVTQQSNVFRAIQEGIEHTNRAIPMLAYLDYYLDTGVAEEQAIEQAINNMSLEQVGYAKANWPGWVYKWYARPFTLFKQFAMEQAMNYYGAMRRSFAASQAPDDVVAEGPEAVRQWQKLERRSARIQLAVLTGMLVAIGGFWGVPVWEPIRLLMYLFGLTENWEVFRSESEKKLAGMTGLDMPTEAALHGLPRLVGLDLSSRVAQDSLLFYQQPKDMSNEQWLQVIGQMAGGAPLGTILSMKDAIGGTFGDQSYPKWLSQMPFPGAVKDIFKAYDTAVNGPTTKTGVHTDKPPSTLEALVQFSGLRTRSQVRPFEVGSAAQQRSKEYYSRHKSELVQRVMNQGMTEQNAKKIKDWNREQTDPKMRITVKTIANARKRRTKIERETQAANR